MTMNPIKFEKSISPSCCRGTILKTRICHGFRSALHWQKNSNKKSLLILVEEHIKGKREELFLDVDPDYFKAILNGLKLVVIYPKYIKFFRIFFFNLRHGIICEKGLDPDLLRTFMSDLHMNAVAECRHITFKKS